MAGVNCSSDCQSKPPPDCINSTVRAHVSFPNVTNPNHTHLNVQHRLKLNIIPSPVKSGSMLRWIVPQLLCDQHHTKSGSDWFVMCKRLKSKVYPVGFGMQQWSWTLCVRPTSNTHLMFLGFSPALMLPYLLDSSAANLTFSIYWQRAQDLLQYYSVLQSTTPELRCTTRYYSSTTTYYSSTTLYYKVLLHYYSILQSTPPVQRCHQHQKANPKSKLHANPVGTFNLQWRDQVHRQKGKA